jgi:hypothetical protein
MATPTEELLARVLRLPLRDRARVAKEVIASLDEGSADAGARAAWAKELEVRARDVVAGRNVVEEDGTMFRNIRNELSFGRATPPATPRRRTRAKGGGKAVRGRRPGSR